MSSRVGTLGKRTHVQASHGSSATKFQPPSTPEACYPNSLGVPISEVGRTMPLVGVVSPTRLGTRPC